MKNKRKIFLLLSFLSLFICLYFVSDTYAKYLTRASAGVNGKIAKWNIVVNDTNVKNNDTLTEVITPVFAGNTHVAQNVIAPTVTGYFDLELDATDVEVSFTYNTSVTRNSSLRDFIVTGYKVDNGEVIDVDTSVETPTISNDILLSDTTRVHTIRVYIGWNDDVDTQELNNAQDTAVTSNLDEVNLTVNMSFIQKAS